MTASGNIILIEPFYTGSHKVLMDMLHENLTARGDVKVHLATLPGKKWPWRARTSALHFSQTIEHQKYTTIFTSCVLPLHELLGLRSDLHHAFKIIYFHENQLVYPVRKSKDRDFQYGYNQILSCLAADQIWFNSAFNQESFLSNIKAYFKLQPDFRPKDLRSRIEPKCFVKYFPIDFNKIDTTLNAIDSSTRCKNENLRIVWPHRWEFDKNPELFFRVLFRIIDGGITNFRLSILGENFKDNPPIFLEAREKLNAVIDHFGYVSSKAEYYKILKESDVVVSTSDHEFFGVSMMEAVYLGCFPVCPNNLVYPELYENPKYLYKSEEDLFKKICNLISNFSNGYYENETINVSKYNWENLKHEFLNPIITATS